MFLDWFPDRWEQKTTMILNNLFLINKNWIVDKALNQLNV